MLMLMIEKVKKLYKIFILRSHPTEYLFFHNMLNKYTFFVDEAMLTKFNDKVTL